MHEAENWLYAPVADDVGNCLFYFLGESYKAKGTQIIARAIMAERQRFVADFDGAADAGIDAAIAAERERTANLLKDPAAVRLNYLRGDIACQTLIDEAIAAERERCKRIVERSRGRLIAHVVEMIDSGEQP